MKDFFYGANASFPKAVQWHAWFEYWQTHIGDQSRQVRFLIDSTMKLQQTIIKVSRIIRKNLDYTRGYTMDEMRNIKDVAEEAAVWYRKNRPRDEDVKGFDSCLLILYQALDGAYAVTERLAQELDLINRKGYFMIDTGDEVAELRRS